MKGVIENREKVAEGILSVDFELSESVDFIPGQYFFVTLINPPYTDAKGNQRHFSITNSPSQKCILSMVTRIREGSAFKRSLRDMPIGSKVEIGAIAGRFVLPEDIEKPIVFIAGGIGITPYMAMLRYIKEEGLGYKITLIYSNRDEKSTVFLKELKKMEDNNFKLILTKVVDEQIIRNNLPKFKSLTYYISGPPKMVEAINTILTSMGIEDIKTDEFTGY